MNDPVLQNMIDLHHDAALSCQLKWGQNEYLHWVNNKQSHWPRSLIGTMPTNEVKRVVEWIEKHKVPPFWAFDGNNGAQQVQVLEQNGFREIYRWKGMMLDSDNFKPVQEASQVFAEPVSDDEAMQQWGTIVKDVMLPNLSYTAGLLSHWFKNDNYIAAIARDNEKPVSTGLAYMKSNIAGLYFIATLPENRGNGFASSLVSDLIKQCLNRGAHKIVLHASEAGEKMYRSMGFKYTSPISTYWKVGIF